MFFIQRHFIGVQPVKRIANSDTAPTQLTDVKIGTIQQPVIPHHIKNSLKCARLCDGVCVEPDIAQLAQAVDAFDGVPRVKAPCRVRHN